MKQIKQELFKCIWGSLWTSFNKVVWLFQKTSLTYSPTIYYVQRIKKNFFWRYPADVFIRFFAFHISSFNPRIECEWPRGLIWMQAIAKGVKSEFGWNTLSWLQIPSVGGKDGILWWCYLNVGKNKEELIWVQLQRRLQLKTRHKKGKEMTFSGSIIRNGQFWSKTRWWRRWWGKPTLAAEARRWWMLIKGQLELYLHLRLDHSS